MADIGVPDELNKGVVLSKTVASATQLRQGELIINTPKIVRVQTKRGRK